MNRLKLIVVASLLLFSCFLRSQVFKWATTYNSTSTEKDLAWGVTTDGSGNVYTVGGAKDFPTHDYYVYIIKYNSTGSQQWATTVNNTLSTTGICDQERGYCISVDANGYVWVAAVTYSGATNYDDLTLIRLNSAGTLQSNYPKRYSVATDNCGGGVPELGTALYVYDPSTVYIGGKNYNNSTSTWSFILLKDNVGATTWSWVYTKAGTLNGPDRDHQVTDIKADANNVYATGWIQNTNQNKDIWTVSITHGGTTNWTAQYDAGANTYMQLATALGVDNSGNLYVAGQRNTSSGKEALLLKYNSSGALQTGFPVFYNGSSSGDDGWSDIAVLPSGGSIAVYVGGYAFRGSPYCFDYCVAAYTSTGGNGWTNPAFYDGAASESSSLVNFDKGYAIEYSANSGRVYITGRAKENTPNTGDINISTAAFNASTGASVWSVTYDYGSQDIANLDEMQWKYGMQVKWNSVFCQDEIFIAGDKYTAANGYDFVTLKYGPNGNPCEGPEGERLQQGSTATLYPNPFTERAEIVLENSVANGNLLIYDASGRTVRSISNINGNRILIERGDLLPGVYLFRLSEIEEVITMGRFMIID